MDEFAELESVLEVCQIMELPYTGARLTWSNKQKGKDKLERKIDRVLVNDAWMDSFDNTKAFFDTPGTSYHSPAVVILRNEIRRRKYPFKYKNFWGKEVEFESLIRAAWNVDEVGSRQFKLMRKLKSVKEVLKPWDKARFPELQTKIKLEKGIFHELQLRARTEKNNAALEDQITNAEASLRENVARLISLIAQRAKLHWLTMGEETSSMFYRCVKERQARNAILLMCDENGNEMEDEQTICQHIVGFFTELLSSTAPTYSVQNLPSGAVISESATGQLITLPSYDEVRKSIWAIAANKSPGPDGFGSQFFKDAWKIVGVDTCEAVREIFRHGKILKQFNSTFISLIPKVPNPTFVKDLRPISCCNTILKVVTKILVGRIKGLLNDIISDSQGAFISGRSLAHNYAIATEIMTGYGTKRV